MTLYDGHDNGVSAANDVGARDWQCCAGRFLFPYLGKRVNERVREKKSLGVPD